MTIELAEKTIEVFESQRPGGRRNWFDAIFGGARTKIAVNNLFYEEGTKSVVAVALETKKAVNGKRRHFVPIGDLMGDQVKLPKKKK